MKKIFETILPCVLTIFGALVVYVSCKTGFSDTAIGNFVKDFSHNMLLKDSINIFITIEGILFAGLLTFLGLFLQLDNVTMSFIKKSSDTYCRLLCFIKIPIISTLFALVSSIVIYGLTMHIHWCIQLLWGSIILYSLLVSIRMIYVYFIILTPVEKSN